MSAGARPRASVIVFPGSNCDRDVKVALEAVTGKPAQMVWHGETELPPSDIVVLPGGFSYGDYLRCGAMAAHSNIMRSVIARAKAGTPVLGICNGFQVLCEAGLLPGALLLNSGQRFRCEDVFVRVETIRTPFTAELTKGDVLRLPIAHGDGNWRAEAATFDDVTTHDQVVFRYCDAAGRAPRARTRTVPSTTSRASATGSGTSSASCPTPSAPPRRCSATPTARGSSGRSRTGSSAAGRPETRNFGTERGEGRSLRKSDPVAELGRRLEKLLEPWKELLPRCLHTARKVFQARFDDRSRSDGSCRRSSSMSMRSIRPPASIFRRIRSAASTTGISSPGSPVRAGGRGRRPATVRAARRCRSLPWSRSGPHREGGHRGRLPALRRRSPPTADPPRPRRSERTVRWIGGRCPRSHGRYRETRGRLLL